MIKVLFTTSNNSNIGSALLRSRMGMSTPFSHTALYVYIKEFHSEIVFDVVSYGVRAINYNVFCEKNRIVDAFEINASEEEVHKIIKNLFSLLGAEFCFTTLFKLWGKYNFKLPLKISRNRKEKFTCSEFVFYVLEFLLIDSKYIMNKDFNPRVMNPKDLYWTLNEKYRLGLPEVKIGKGVVNAGCSPYTRPYPQSETMHLLRG